jgi:hypothetical protein
LRNLGLDSRSIFEEKASRWSFEAVLAALGLFTRLICVNGAGLRNLDLDSRSISDRIAFRWSYGEGTLHNFTLKAAAFNA